MSKRPYGGGTGGIEEIAGKLRDSAVQRFCASKAPRGGDDVRQMLNALVGVYGGFVSIAKNLAWEETEGGSLVVAPGGKSFEIRLSPLTSALRDNFTIAHELGHFFLHYPHREPSAAQVSFNRYGSDMYETQANRFAAALLMPIDEFTTCAKAGWDSFKLAAHFGVSQPAVAARLDSLGLSAG